MNKDLTVWDKSEKEESKIRNLFMLFETTFACYSQNIFTVFKSSRIQTDKRLRNIMYNTFFQLLLKY